MLRILVSYYTYTDLKWTLSMFLMYLFSNKIVKRNHYSSVFETRCHLDISNFFL